MHMMLERGACMLAHAFRLCASESLRVFPTGAKGFLRACQVAGGYRQPLPHYVPQQVRDLISQCWAQDLADRPPIAAVLDRLKQIDRLGVVDGPTPGRPPGTACCVLM
jgi:hypothetical protein